MRLRQTASSLLFMRNATHNARQMDTPSYAEGDSWATVSPSVCVCVWVCVSLLDICVCVCVCVCVSISASLFDS